MRKRIIDHIPTIVSVVASVILLAVTMVWFSKSIGQRVGDNYESYLVENTRAFAKVFGTRLDDQIVLLKSQARLFEDIDLNDRGAVSELIMSTKGIGDFKTIGYADSAGDTINNSGLSSGNIIGSDFFKGAMSGNIMFSKNLTKDEDGEYVLSVGIPIMTRNVPTGVIYGSFEKTLLSTLINMSERTGKQANLLIDNNGEILAATDGFDTDRMGISNFFDNTGAEKPVNDHDTVKECMIGGTRMITAVTSVGVHGWYYVSLLPKSVVEEQLSDISRDYIILVLITAIAFVILIISILYLIKSNTDILRTNEKFKLVTVESQDIVFDYNFQKQVLVLDGNIDNITSAEKNEFSRNETLGFISLIHDEDKDIKNRILEVINTDEPSIKGEFRIKCIDGTYSWFRMKGTVVRAHDGHAQRMIGSLINVDEQMNRDMRLIEKDETDALTGVYNKSAFYDHVNEQLRSASDSDLFAIYIIDIDNFKAVNDDLGHAMGDQVLSDVAKKLCIVFSDMDYVGRAGGDEFAAFLHLSSKARNVGMNIIEGKARAICAHLSDTYHAKKKQVSITASVGVAIYPYSGRDYNSLFRKAAKALEKAKNNGKNQYGIFTPEDT